jgi:hypothetical protein
LVASFFALPIADQLKWSWPWMTFRSQILEFQAGTDAAADRLGFPVGRKLTAEELATWSAATPLRLKLDYPIVGTQVTVSVVSPGSDARLEHGMVWRGGAGRVDPHSVGSTCGE